MSTQPSRNRFAPELCGETPSSSLVFLPHPDTDVQGIRAWTPVLRCPADFPEELFEAAVMQMVEHPEWNSTLILRTETVHHLQEPNLDITTVPLIKDYIAVKKIRRRLLPRRPGRDEPVQQDCTLYMTEHEHEKRSLSLLILTPVLAAGEELPYYHPAVDHLALRYVPSVALAAPTTTDEASVSSVSAYGELQVLVVPHDGAAPQDPSSRLHRTCRALLETIHRYGWGALTSYKKRVRHDYLVPRETYQDLYLVMRERHKKLVNTWVEGTDPLKHVFEVKARSFDIGIATFLILLWRDMFKKDGDPEEYDLKNEPWKQWPRPPNGYLDLGCGNGLLVHILTSEGYLGTGIDVRKRQSWATYTPETQARLHETALDPTTPFDSQTEPWWQSGVFIVANHSDELTPWAPVLATLRHASGYLSIPCCPFTFDERFSRESAKSANTPWSFLFEDLSLMGSNITEDEDEDTAFLDRLGLGGDPNAHSGYHAYRVWLAKLALACGWDVECDVLRIPSTRNWAILGRERIGEETSVLEKMDRLMVVVKNRGLFKTRRPEGRSGDH